MSTIRRVYVRKKARYQIEAAQMRADLAENLNIQGITGLQIINCYDMEDMTAADFEQCKNTILSEPPVDDVFEDRMDWPTDAFVFRVKYLPGQYDQRADSAVQCIQAVSQGDPPPVEASKVYVITGTLSEKEKALIRQYAINPVDSMACPPEKPDSLRAVYGTPQDIAVFEGFTAQSEADLLERRQTLGLAMSPNDLLFCRAYFRDAEQRDPTVTEIRVIDTYWSDHCRHTTFLTNIDRVVIEPGRYEPVVRRAYDLYQAERASVYGNRAAEKDVCLMDIAVMGMKALKKKGLLADLDESDEINACSIVVEADVDGRNEQWLVLFKNETHNHPTEIEPFGGAATCLGGAIRDPLSGRAYVYQAMRVTGSGDPTKSVLDTLPGKLPQRKITQGAAAGYSSYGNQIGLATGLVTEIYDEGYVAKRMEIGAVVGAVRKDNVVRLRPVKGDAVILVGGRTGRDGCGGATGSSKEHTADSILTCGAEVQKGNPPTERKLQRLFRNPAAQQLIKRCNDFGAGGVAVAIGELAEGLTIDLDAVPKKYEGLDGTELAISESQERMAVVVAAAEAAAFVALADEENLEAVVVATVTDDRRLRMIWRGKTIVDLSRDFLDTNGAKQRAEALIPTDKAAAVAEAYAAAVEKEPDLAAAWRGNLSSLNVAAQKGLGERFDGTIGAGTVLMPFGGTYQLTPSEVMAAKLPVGESETTTATLMAHGYNPTIARQSPFHGAALAVVESAAKIVAAGGRYDRIRLTFQEYFERLGEDPLRWGKPFAALLGAFYAQMRLGIPSIGGKDSMSGTFHALTVPPTLVSFAIVATKTDAVLSNEFKKAGSPIVLLKTAYDADDLPDFDRLKETFARVRSLAGAKKLLSAHTVGVGGAAAAVTKMAFGNMLGAALCPTDAATLFRPAYGSFVLEMDCAPSDLPALFDGADYSLFGTTQNEKTITVSGTVLALADCLRAWLLPLETVFPTRLLDQPRGADDCTVRPCAAKPFKNGASVKIARPRVLIPIFPGTNCEYDTAKQFALAGAIVEPFVIKNQTGGALQASVAALAQKIKEAQIIAFPGGFSAGDEPEGSGKFIAGIFRSPALKEAVARFLNDRDGLILGICNGFQALIKLGLVPYGDIWDMTADSPTLTFNTIGRHVSTLVRTKIVSTQSPWMRHVSLGDIHTVAVSHGEGRFVADAGTISRLAANGQIATQYVDFDGNPATAIPWNPNGSLYAVEGIFSPDGRVFGKMGHSERIGKGLYQNVPGEKDQGLFLSGVEYFM